MANIRLEELGVFAREVAEKVRARARFSREGAFVMYLSGDLGSGKTTFMQAFARELGIKDAVKSPTFVLMKKYPLVLNGFAYLVHIDAYRLEGAEEFQALKPETFLNDPRALVCVEWPEQINGALPKPDIYLKFRAGKEADMREIEIIEN